VLAPVIRDEVYRIAAKCYVMLSGTHRHVESRLRFCTAKTKLRLRVRTMEKAWTRRCWRKADAQDTGVCQVFESEPSKWARNWMFGAKPEPEQKFN
jgi:hypothetical protein